MMAYPKSWSFSFSAVWKDSDFSFDPPPSPPGYGCLAQNNPTSRNSINPYRRLTNYQFRFPISHSTRGCESNTPSYLLRMPQKTTKSRKGARDKTNHIFQPTTPISFPLCCQNGPRKALYLVLGTKSMNYLDSVNMHLSSPRSKEDVLILPRI